jgi:hypothetical protein
MQFTFCTMGNQCAAQDYSPGGGGTASKNRMNQFDSSTLSEQGSSPRSSNKRLFPWGIPRLSGMSFGSSSAASTPYTADSARFFDIIKKTSSMSALDLQQQEQNKNVNINDQDEEDENTYNNASPESSFLDSPGDFEEPFFLGMRTDSFGVGDHHRQTSQRFRTKRFRSRLELGMA